MNRALRMSVLIGVASISSRAVAVDSVAHPQSPRRQLVACMTKQMSASKTISYNEATKVCKAQLKSQGATLASSGTAKPAGGMSP
ncbi:MAG: hypothetical protein JWN43_3150 [Gammaproteobacteria bacterium]|nr:hypothetical protein [Gammaproteobacteria bacterium]